VTTLDEHIRRHHDATVAGEHHSSVVTWSESHRGGLTPTPNQPFDHAEFANVAQRGIRVAGAHITSGRFLSADFGSVSMLDGLSRR
jgi:hypothetical protein